MTRRYTPLDWAALATITALITAAAVVAITAPLPEIAHINPGDACMTKGC